MGTRRIALLAPLMLFAVGCSNPDTYAGNVYTAEQAKQVQTVWYGTLTSVQPVKIQSDASGNLLGSLGGAVLGGLLGSTIGGGKGENLAIAGGALAGGLAGNKLEQKASQVDGVQLEIRKDSGETVVVVQKADPVFKPGLRVRLVQGQGTVNVTPAP